MGNEALAMESVLRLLEMVGGKCGRLRQPGMQPILEQPDALNRWHPWKGSGLEPHRRQGMMEGGHVTKQWFMAGLDLSCLGVEFLA